MAQETSLGWYDTWEATTFPWSEGSMNCSVDSSAENRPQEGAWVFVFPGYLQFSPNGGVPQGGVGSVVVDGSTTFDMYTVDGQVGYVADEDDIALLQAMANGQSMTIAIWPQNRPNAADEYVYPLAGFREGYLRIAQECQFDPADVLDAAFAPEPEPQGVPGRHTNPEPQAQDEPETPSTTGGSSLFGNKGK
ncbi:MAG: hypothetical protein R3F55_14480 [Alphaproteobacteria bacterium]